MAPRPSFEDLLARAHAGDARAQYVLSAVLSQAGRKAEAEQWLRASAERRDPEALYTLATRSMRTRAGCAAAAPMLAEAAALGGAAAGRALAVLEAEGFGVAKDDDGARRRVLALAKAGDAPARRDLAGLLLLQKADDPQAGALLHAAAAEDPVAAVVLGARLLAGRTDVEAARAAASLDALAARGFGPAADMRRALGARTFGEGLSATVDFEAAAERAFRPPPSPHAAPENVLAAAAARVYRAALAPEIGAYVVASAFPWLADSTIEAPDGATMRHPTRTSMTATLGPVDLDLTLVGVARSLAAHAGVDACNGEFLSVLRYRPGEEYRPHYDWLPEGAERARGGQRVATAILYLNDAYEGGETVFVRDGVAVRGAPGDILVFRNVDVDGAALKPSYHAGEPVRAGVKWIATRWFRQSTYQF